MLPPANTPQTTTTTNVRLVCEWNRTNLHQDQAVLELRQALLAMESDLKGCQETRAGLRQELGHHAQARRLLEKRAR